MWGLGGAAFILFYGGCGRVHWVQVVQGFGAVSSFRGVFPAFCPLACFVFGALA